MRVTSNLIYNQSAQSMTKASERNLQVQERISEQSDIVRPSDDPNGAAKVMAYELENKRLMQYKDNMTLAKNTLEYSSLALGSINDVLDQINVRIIQSVNTANSQEDWNAIAGEMENLLATTADLMNSRDSNGKYIFAGTSPDSPAFERGTDGRYFFAGNEGTRSAQIADNVSVQVSDSGKGLFQDVPTRSTFTATAGGGGTLESTISDQQAYEQFVKDNFSGLPTATNGFSLTTSAGTPDQFQFVNDDTGAVVASGDYVSGEPITINGMRFTLTGPVGSSVNMTIDPPGRDNVLNQVMDAITALRDPTLTRAQRSEFLDSATTSIVNTQSSMGEVSSSVGSRINTIDNRETQRSATEIFNKSAQEDIGGLDIYKASTELQLSETALSASQLLFSRISSLSLFDRL
ncbi:flagellar hook-associated protein FlgL [Marinomonas ostreistagni]|uniref:flagellar hook-associated protein FlgL n=1 Tax=Marinomonas ostreistagni TaxID=359209 RepID=UPI001950963D|nr:flagellar hook-associated protein FlgL [Marinomonas ostreistagni]MBM6551140.1 flagellar hook-associated protein FlgL [Marinomonas ostreistagni]